MKARSFWSNHLASARLEPMKRPAWIGIFASVWIAIPASDHCPAFAGEVKLDTHPVEMTAKEILSKNLRAPLPTCYEQLEAGKEVLPSFHMSVKTIKDCRHDLSAQARGFEPDVLVTLGGKIMPGLGLPNCHQQQRAHITRQLFDSLGGSPRLLLSGGSMQGPAWPLTPLQLRCENARLEQEAPPHSSPKDDLRLGQDAILPEATHLCAGILEDITAQGGDQVSAKQDHALKQMIFESHSGDTVQNATKSISLMRKLGQPLRALILTTPIINSSGKDIHQARALRAFEAARLPKDPFQFGAIGCHYKEKYEEYSSFLKGQPIP